jgi:uncharacterized membrane protein
MAAKAGCWSATNVRSSSEGKDKAMMEHFENAAQERGGVPLRDYTQSGHSSAFRRSLGISKTPGGLKNINFDKVGRFLILPSLALGVMEIWKPRSIQKLLGLCDDNTRLIQAMGVREMLHALHISMQSRPHSGVWGRVAGDALDLSLLGAAATQPRSKKSRLGLVTAAVAGITALDLLTAARLRRERAEEKRYSTLTQEDLKSRTRNGAFHAVRTITINRSPEDLYSFWRNFENLPQYMYHLESVQVLDDRRSHWVASAPAGVPVSWDAEITDDQPNRRIAWQSTANAAVPNSGSVRFEPGPQGRGTVVTVEIEYRPPGGAVGKAIASLFGKEPSQQIKGDLQRFKQVMETGEVVRSAGSLHGFGQKIQHPARPHSERGKPAKMSRAEKAQMRQQKKAQERAQKMEQKLEQEREQSVHRYQIS